MVGELSMLVELFASQICFKCGLLLLNAVIVGGPVVNVGAQGEVYVFLREVVVVHEFDLFAHFLGQINVQFRVYEGSGPVPEQGGFCAWNLPAVNA